MTTTKSNKQKGSDPGKAITRPDHETEENEKESQNIISSDTILAEKDEVKNAEERLRLKKKDELKGER